ncbi:hypothetical protein KNE206_45510 [Kitasatospora sp. NE20-6]|uniref:regulatory protein RecX n=1 Tax=Kitasatospora sp. NE20-6 TaxID=2859066 RepID=UPI0034DC0736
MHSHDRPSGSAAPAAEPDDLGPPDWFAAVALPEPEPEPEPSPEPAQPATGGTGAPGVPGLLTASSLPSGRRRRRSALAPDEPAPAADTTGCEPAYEDGAAPESPARATRRRSRSRTDERTGARPAARAEEQADPATRARDICLRLLTGHARSRKQLADALRKREIPDDVADEVLSRYEEVGLIDDAAFAAAWVDSRHGNRGLARRALAQELRLRGVSGDHAEQALARVDAEDEAEAARALVERKLPGTRSLETQTRTRRLVAMLARRGYSEGLAYRVVRDALGSESEGFGEDW